MGNILTFLGIAVSLGLGVWNLIQTRRTQFINTVTSERVKWIQELRNNISALSGAIHTWSTTYAHDVVPNQSEGERELLSEIDRLRYLIRLQLNPNNQTDKEIEALIVSIPKLTNRNTLDLLLSTLESLTQKTQTLLKKEWEKVKEEAAPKLFPDNWSSF